MHADEAGRPHLLLVRTGAQDFREYLLRSLAAHYRIHLVLSVEPPWQRPYVHGWTVVPDTLDTAAMVATARAVHDRDPVRGVLCWDESRIPQAAAMAAALGLPGGDVAAIGRCRDKHLTRLALGAAGVPQPRSVQVERLEDALAAAARIGYPVVLKPHNLVSSMGVARVDTPADLPGHFADIRGIPIPELPDYQARVLVEECLFGEEISVDAAVHGGEVYPLVVARKRIGYPPYCVEVGHHVYADDPLLTDARLLHLLRDTHTALGFTGGVTHTEIMLTADGPKIIEVNGRLGGDLIPYLGLRATGVDTALAAAAVARGRAPMVVADRKLFAGVRFFWVDTDDTRVESVRFDPAGLPPAIDRTAALVEPGTIASPPPKGTTTGRIAYATAVAETAEECEAALTAAAAALRVNS